jgi:uncharacterized protein (TIGR00251 family)
MLIHVKIKPDSKEDKIVEKNDTSFIVYVKEPAEDNRANKRLVELLAERFNIVKSKIKIVTGHHAPSKILDIMN